VYVQFLEEKTVFFTEKNFMFVSIVRSYSLLTRLTFSSGKPIFHFVFIASAEVKGPLRAAINLVYRK